MNPADVFLLVGEQVLLFVSSSESELTADVGEENELSPESRLVDEITAEGGIRPIPSRDALLHFSSR